MFALDQLVSDVVHQIWDATHGLSDSVPAQAVFIVRQNVQPHL